MKAYFYTTKEYTGDTKYFLTIAQSQKALFDSTDEDFRKTHRVIEISKCRSLFNVISRVTLNENSGQEMLYHTSNTALIEYSNNQHTYNIFVYVNENYDIEYTIAMVK